MKRQIHPNLGFCSQCVTCWSNGGDNSPSWKLELRFLKSLSCWSNKVEHPDQKCRHPDTLIKRWDTQKVFAVSSVTWWSNGGDNSPSWKLELRFLKFTCWSKDQWKLELRFLNMLIKRWRHPDQKAETPKGRDTLIKRCRHPNLGFWSQYKCHLLIKWWRQLPLLKVGT